MLYNFKEKKVSHSNARNNKVNKLCNYSPRVHICLYKMPPSRVTSHTENLYPANATAWVTSSLIQRPLNRMWAWLLVSVALDQATSAHEVSPFLSLHRDISVNSEQWQLFNMEQWLERANILGRTVTESIYACGKEQGKKRGILTRMKIAGVQIPIWL